MQSEQQQRIMGYFIEEAKDHLETIEKGLLNLQGTIGDPELISEVFRAAHSVKGGAAMLGLDSIQQTSHRLEDYFKVLKECPITVDQKLETLFLRVFDTLQDLLEQLQGPFGLTQEKAAEMMQGVDPIFGQLHNHLNGLVAAAGGTPLEAHHPVISAQPTTSSTPAQTSDKALQQFFQKTVGEQLRSLLALFKKADTPQSRQQLQDICQSLAEEGQSLGASTGWQELVTSAQRAIAYEENTYRQLAPVVIKALKQAQDLGINNRGEDITAHATLLDLLPPDTSDITQDDALMDELIADASRNADQVLDTVIDDTLGLEGEMDMAALGVDEGLVSNGSEGPTSGVSNPASDADISDLLDTSAVDTPPTDNSTSADEAEEFDIDWLQSSFSESSLSGDSDEEWVSEASESESDHALDDGLGLIDDMDAIPTPETGGDIDNLLDQLDETTDEEAEQIGPQVGPDEMDSLADLFSGDSTELTLDWTDEGDDGDSADDLSDDLDLDATNDFSDLLFDADSDDDIPQDLTADEDDISTLLNTLEMDSDNQDDGELATTPISLSAVLDTTLEDSGLDELLTPPSTSNDIEEKVDLELGATGPDLTFENSISEDPDGLSILGDPLMDEDMVSNPDDEASQSPDGMSLDNLGGFLDGDEDALLEIGNPQASESTPKSQLSSEEFDELFVGLDSEDAVFENQELDSSTDNTPTDFTDDVISDEVAPNHFEVDPLGDEETSTESGSDDILGDLWADNTEAESNATPMESPSTIEDAWDIQGDEATMDSPLESSPTMNAGDVDVLDNLFGAPSAQDMGEELSTQETSNSFDEAFGDVDTFSDGIEDEHLDRASSSLPDDQDIVDSLGLEDANLFGSEAFSPDDSEDSQESLFDDAPDFSNVNDLALEADNSQPEHELGIELEALGSSGLDLELEGLGLSEPESDLGLDLEGLGSSELGDTAPELTDVEDTDQGMSEEGSLDDVLGGIFDHDLGSEPIITDHDIPVMADPDDQEGMDLAAMFMRDVADDASVTLSIGADDLTSENTSVDSSLNETDNNLGDVLDDLGLTDSLTPVPNVEDTEATNLNDHDRESFDIADDFAELGERLDSDSSLLTEDDPFSGLDDLLESGPENDMGLDLAIEEETGAAEGITATNSDNVEEDDFADLEALLSEPELEVEIDDGGEDTDNSDDGFADLEKLLEDADQSLGGPPSTSSDTRQAASPPRRPTRRGLSNQTMRVAVKNLDNLNNLVGELVVNRNSLEQSQERLRQFLDNLLYQVQQLSDVGQRMRDLYERSLLESSLLSSRRSYQATMPGDQISTDSSHATGASFDALEMDRFTGFHTLSQEMIELIVRVRESASDIDFVVDESDQVTRMFRQVTTQLQEGLTRTRMVPFAQAADRLPRAVRDISIKCGKQAKLVVEGRDTLIDKMILEQLYDPMTHLVNNAITHGIEAPDERVDKNKSPVGTITIRSFHQGNQTIISVTDDGGGIDPDIVSRKAIEKELITAQEAEDMSRLDIYDLLFHHGFSTRDKADDFAGRGVGMDVVRTSLAEIRGVVNIDSTIDQGTTFTIRLPLTLSISKALLCVSNRARIAFPMDGVEDMLDVPQDRIQADDQGRPSIMWRDILLPFRPLSDLLKFHRSLGRGSVYGGGPEDDVISVVVLRSGGNYLALQVDQVLGEQEIVIKQLEAPIPKPTGIAGATVLGDGRIMPIADVLELIDLSMGRIRRDAGSQLWEQSEDTSISDTAVTASEPTVLIVDDSITVRELLSMTFNKVGYRVEQARDGQEAWEKLRSGLPCDLVFCDIEMPRMDGLELLSRLQKDSNFNRLPIAMLTSRGADRHRQMAVQLGAKGYFTKPYLEEALLDAAQRMLKGEVLVGSDG